MVFEDVNRHVGDVGLSPPHCHPGVHILARDLFQYGRRLLLLCGRDWQNCAIFGGLKI